MADETNLEEMEQSLEGAEEGASGDLEKSLEEGADASSDKDKKEASGASSHKFELTEEQKGNLAMILDLPLKVTVELGRSRVLIQDILQYGQGSVVELNKKAGDPLEVTVNEQLIAKGEVVVVNEKFAVRILEIVDPETRIKKMGAAGKDSTQILNHETTGNAEGAAA